MVRNELQDASSSHVGQTMPRAVTSNPRHAAPPTQPQGHAVPLGWMLAVFDFVPSATLTVSVQRPTPEGPSLAPTSAPAHVAVLTCASKLAERAMPPRTRDVSLRLLCGVLPGAEQRVRGKPPAIWLRHSHELLFPALAWKCRPSAVPSSSANSFGVSALLPPRREPLPPLAELWHVRANETLSRACG